MGAGTTSCRQSMIGLRLTCRVERSLTEANVQAGVLSSVEGRPAITSPSSSHSAPASVPRLCRAAE
jgi:proline racemase